MGTEQDRKQKNILSFHAKGCSSVQLNPFLSLDSNHDNSFLQVEHDKCDENHDYIIKIFSSFLSVEIHQGLDTPMTETIFYYWFVNKNSNLFQIILSQSI